MYQQNVHLHSVTHFQMRKICHLMRCQIYCIFFKMKMIRTNLYRTHSKILLVSLYPNSPKPNQKTSLSPLIITKANRQLSQLYFLNMFVIITSLTELNCDINTTLHALPSLSLLSPLLGFSLIFYGLEHTP